VHDAAGLRKLEGQMMIRAGTLALTAACAAQAAAGELTTCDYNGIPLWGDVQVVTSFPDFTVRVVDSFPDLDVQQVDSFPDSCGRWRFVESFPDFRIQFVDSFPDLEIRMVTAFPGLP
jgi:hypothetical protein